MTNVITEERPIEASAGGDNACLVRCKTYNSMRHYAVCLRVIDKFESGTPSDIDKPCNARLEEGSGCPAFEMRAKELEAGKALFYEPRQRPLTKGVTIFDRSYERGFRLGKPWPPASESSSSRANTGAEAARVSPARPAVQRPPVSTKQDAGNDYASLVNRMMEEEEAKEKVSAPVPPGGGLLEVARRMRAENSQ